MSIVTVYALLTWESAYIIHMHTYFQSRCIEKSNVTECILCILPKHNQALQFLVVCNQTSLWALYGSQNWIAIHCGPCRYYTCMQLCFCPKMDSESISEHLISPVGACPTFPSLHTARAYQTPMYQPPFS